MNDRGATTPYVVAGLLALAALALAGFMRVLDDSNGAPAGAERSPWRPNGASYVRAAHYFGGEWVKNFWNADLAGIDRDLAQIKRDGFDTIVVVVPWGEFQPKLFPPRLNKAAFRRLGTVMRAAERHRLGVVARVSYTWDFQPGADLPTTARFGALYTDERVYDAWLRYMGALGKALLRYPNFHFAFLTWEDFWQIAGVDEHADTAARRRLARATGFDDYLRSRYTLRELPGVLGRPVETWDDVAVPARKTAAFRAYLDFVDHQLINRIYVPARRRFQRLSMESRVDWDPIWTDPDAPNGWYQHDAQFRLPGAPFVTIYWAPSIGALNVGEAEPAATVIERLRRILDSTSNLAGGKLFIDQLIFRDNSLQFRRNARIRPRDVRAFLRCAAPLLRRSTRGYALWAYRDYATNTVYNPAFALGLRGWDVRGNVAPASPGAVRLARDGALSQRMPIDRDPESPWAKRVFVELHGHSATGAPARLVVRLDGRSRVITLGPRSGRVVASFPRAGLASYDLELRASGPPVVLSDVRVYSFVASGGMRRVNGSAGPEVAAVRELNRALVGRSAAACPAGG